MSAAGGPSDRRGISAMKATTHSKTPFPVEPTEDEIREHAYQLWLQNGQPEGRDLEHWFSAREALAQNARVRRAPASQRPVVTVKGATDGPRIVVDATGAAEAPMPPVPGGVLPGTLVHH
jgi:hypothetical protein